MLKTFTLDNRKEQQLTATKGSIAFHITDESGDSRVITGSTFLDENKVAQGVSSENKRELPLIEGLFRLELGESTEIEFDHYNEVFDRDTNKTVNQVAYDTVKEIEKEKSFFYRIARFLKGRSVHQAKGV